MKKKLISIILLVLAVVLMVVNLSACDNTPTFKITVMDGENEITTFSVEQNSTLNKEKIYAKLEKQGYELVGLYTDEAFENVFVFESEVVSSITLYAQYKQRKLYISVKPEEGVSAVEKIPVTTGAAYTVPVPVKEGYRFTGYTYTEIISEDEEREVAFPLTGTFELADSIRLVAHWELLTFDVRFFDGEDLLSTQKVNYASTITLPFVPYKTGYTFADWRLEGATTGFDQATEIKANTDLYANYTPKTYKIMFADDLGLAQISLRYGEAYSLTRPKDKTGYNFVAFKREGETFAESGTYTIPYDIQLIGEWKIKTFDVTFLNADESEIAKQENISYNTLAKEITVKGHTVQGYYLDKAFTAAQEVNLATTPITANTTLYVKAAANEYRLTVAGWQEASIDVIYGEAYALPAVNETDPVLKALLDAKVGDGSDKEWSGFSGYKYGTQDFAATGTYLYDSNITVTPVKTDNDYYGMATVTFWDTVANAEFKDETVAKGDSVAAEDFPTTEKTGYTFNYWYYLDSTDTKITFNAATAVNASMTVYADYTAKNYRITVKDIADKDGDALAVIDVTFGKSYTIEAPTKRGYTFDAATGYKDGDNNGFAATGTYSTDNNVTIYATYNRIEATVSFLGDVDLEDAKGYLYQTLRSFLPSENPTKTGYTFQYWTLTPEDPKQADYDAEVKSTSSSVYAVFTPNEYTITIYYSAEKQEEIKVTYGGNYELPTPIKPGATFDHFIYTDTQGAHVFATTGQNYQYENITLTIQWNVDTSLFVEDTAGKYFKERTSAEEDYTYVFLTGIEYTFDKYTLSATDATSYISLSAANKFTAINATPGSTTFSLTATPEHGESKTIAARVVENVNTISWGNDYNKGLNAATDSNVKVFINQTETYKMTIGRANYIPDITIGNLAHASLNLEQANIVVTRGENGDTEASYTISGGSITFTDSEYNNQDAITLTYKPKYALSEYNLTALQQVVKTNDGVNVYNNNQLKAYYNNPSISEINILRDIEAELAETDYDLTKGGHGKQIEDITVSNNADMSDPYQISVDTGTPYNNFASSVYTRTTNNVNDRIVINGNYHSIDGSKLPYIDNAHDKYSAEGGSKYVTGDSYLIANVQTGIFLYRCCTLDTDGSMVKEFNGGQVTINDLEIGGNYIHSDVAAQSIAGQANPLLKMSASYLGIVIRGGTANVNNVSIKDTTMAFMLDGGVSGYYQPGINAAYGGAVGQVQENEAVAVRLNADTMRITHTWATAIYLFDLCAVDLRTTEIGQCSGPAIQAHDRPYGGKDITGSRGYSNLTSVLNMDTHTAKNINSWINGDEAWFSAYGYQAIAQTVKGLIEEGNGTPQYPGITNFGYTLYGNGAEKMNFAVLCLPSDLYMTVSGPAVEYSSAWAADPQGGASLSINGTSYSGFYLIHQADEGSSTAPPYVAGEAYGIKLWLPVYAKKQ